MKGRTRTLLRGCRVIDLARRITTGVSDETGERESRFSRFVHRSDLCSHVCASIIAICSVIKRTELLPSPFHYFIDDAKRDDRYASPQIISAAAEFISFK